MHLFNIFVSGIAFMVATVSALPTTKELDLRNAMFTGNPFELTKLTVDRVAGVNVSMVFTMYNPDPSSKMTVNCTGGWPFDSRGWPAGNYASCSGGYFGWYISDFVSWTDFSLELKDTFDDAGVGSPVTIFGVAEYTSDVMKCEPYNGNSEKCTQADGSIVSAPIDRSVA